MWGLRARLRAGRAGPALARVRRPVDHVIILDGTLSTLTRGQETNAGLTYKLLRDRMPTARLALRYEPGIQWQDWRGSMDVIQGRGINRQIRRAYGALASRWRPGDRIYLFGYSRGAYAVRSLAGIIDSVGLLRPEHATERWVEQAYRHYRAAPNSPTARAFRRSYCHDDVPIEMIGVWDTVKALGLRLPIIWRWSEGAHAFHSHDLGLSVRRGYHALALDETRDAYAPVLWTTPPGFAGEIVQMWFPGTHGDVGGQLGGDDRARPLSNLPLTWMLDRAEAAGLDLPPGWRARFPVDATAPSVGTLRGWGKFFLARHARVVGCDPSEAIHPAAEAPQPIASGTLTADV
ncbi:DUF2235 domain-containing protein [Mesobaculum littorinae]|uniref:DUF2235 domain-containing protein n=1 Tax=Mesobaculum littorinae TaxID=2486419 RepID=UPI0038B2D440